MIRNILFTFAILSFSLVSTNSNAAKASKQKLTSSNPQLTNELKERRSKVFDLMKDNSMLILLPAKTKNRSNDVDWMYRQTNEMYYLTGMPLAETYLVMIKDGRKKFEYLFFKQGNPQYVQWLGILPSVEQVKKDTGISRVYGQNKFKPFLQSVMNGREFRTGKRTRTVKRPEFYDFYKKLIDGKITMMFSLGTYRNLEPRELSEEAKLSQKMSVQFPELKIRNITAELNRMREIKSPFEIQQMQAAIDVTIEAQKKAMHRVQTADYEYQVQALIDYTFKDQGACCTSFPSITASGDSTTILHYETPVAKIKKDKLFLSDIGAEYGYYAADVTRTYPANGVFSDTQREIYSAVLKAQKIGIKNMRVGSTINKISKAVRASIGEDLLAMGLIAKNEPEQISVYFPHGFGHSLGLDVHDTFIRFQKLKKNMVYTMEPGIYVRKSKVVSSSFYKKLDEASKKKVDAAVAKYDGMGVRIEDDILITSRRAKILSAAAPREIKDIEQWMANSKLSK